MRPYLIIPQLIEQPTWGGDYIVNLKGWGRQARLATKKIGQSYELSSSSLLATEAVDSKTGLSSSNIPSTPLLSTLGQGETMPLLIKLNQARGNSFQLHIKSHQRDDTWKPKPESWYFLEKGYISLGVNPQTSIGMYKKTCLKIDEYMKNISQDIQKGKIDVKTARLAAWQFIQKQNPWRYVNRHNIDKYDLIDLSIGGIHHSWEEDPNNPMGNVVYEVQLDVTDDESTMRSFDQGKIKDDGTIRTIHIEDYFTHIDTNPRHNEIDYLRRKEQGDTLLKTQYYVLDRVKVSGKRLQHTDNRWHHIYVQDGAIELTGGDTTLHVAKGHSCFIPSGVNGYVISSDNATILVTHLPKE